MFNKYAQALMSLFILLLTSEIALSATEFVNVEGNGASFSNGTTTQSVIGVWSSNDRITFSASGNYTMSLSDFSAFNNFDYLGAMITDGKNKIAEVKMSSDGIMQDIISFDIAQGEYWISIFAISNSDVNNGTLGLDLSLSGSMAPVPLPAAGWMLLAAIVGLGTVAKKRKDSTR